jgi:cytochrome c peroxidase
MRSKAVVYLCLVFLIGFLNSFISSSTETGDIPPQDTVHFVVPSNFPPPVYDFKGNPVTQKGFALGRLLFNDPLLSRDRSVSCSSCHQSFAAFSHLDHPVSHGVDDCLGTRNAPALYNLAWQREFMWDGGVRHIEMTPLTALSNVCEMDNDLEFTLTKLRESPVYPLLFRRAFGSSFINSQRMLMAIAQFTSMLISSGSKYDQFIRKENGIRFTETELKGYALFKANCASCHTEPLFTDRSFRNNGLDVNSVDPGRSGITHKPADKGKFRVPSLRNVELSSPYMHDGRFNTLEEVLDHYTSGVKKSATLDLRLTGRMSPGIRLGTPEKKQLIDFLKTLTDTKFVNDERFH